MIKNSILTIAITGHRDIPLEHEIQLKNIIMKIILEIKSKHPDKLIHFLSPLAEGADQIAAIAALETQCKLIVPIPMKENAYLSVFNPRSKERYKSLLKLASESYILSCNSCQTKEDFFVNLGYYLLANSDILIAAWDGNISDKKGGTGYLVKKFIDINQSSSDSNHIKIKTLYHITVPRLSNLTPNKLLELNIYNTQHKE